MEANQITVSDADLRKGAEEGMDAFLKVFTDKYLEVTGGKIDADTMPAERVSAYIVRLSFLS